MISEPRSARKPLRIGVAGPLTGPLRAYGGLLQEVQRALFAAHVEAEVLLLDDRAEEAGARAAAERFLHADCAAVVGHFNSACALAVAPLYARAKIPFLAPCSTHPDLLARGGGYTLRYCPDDRAQVEVFQAFFEARGLPTAEVLAIHDDSAYARSLAALWTRSHPNVSTVLDSRADPRSRAVAYFGKMHHALRFRARQRDCVPDALFIASDDAHLAAYVCQGGPDVEGTFLIGSTEGHSGAVRRCAQHLATVLASDGELRGAALHESLQRGTHDLSFDQHGQRQIAFAVMTIKAGRFEPVQGLPC